MKKQKKATKKETVHEKPATPNVDKKEKRLLTAENLRRVWDRMNNVNSRCLQETAETISFQTESSASLPNVLEVTASTGTFSHLFAQHNKKVAVLTTDLRCLRWMHSSMKPETKKNTLIFEHPMSDFSSFPTLGQPWSVVVLNDLHPFMSNDKEFISLLREVKNSLCRGGLLVISVFQPKTGKRTKQVDGVVINEKFEKIRPRVYQRELVFKSDDDGFRYEEELTSWAVSDIHYCAKAVQLRPLTDHSLDPLSFCCYRND